MCLYLVRHGETRWNVEQRLQGRTDSPLTWRGVEQIRAYAELLRGDLPADAEPTICASPLGRTRQTAWLLAELLGVSSERCSESELLVERHCGSWEGLLRTEIVARHGAEAMHEWRRWDAAVGGDGETLAAVYERARSWLALPRAPAPVVLVTHGVMSRQFRGAYLGLDPAATSALERHTQDRLYRLQRGEVVALRLPQ